MEAKKELESAGRAVHDQQGENVERAPNKKSYETPRLTKLGTVQQLTELRSGVGGDGASKS